MSAHDFLSTNVLRNVIISTVRNVLNTLLATNRLLTRFRRRRRRPRLHYGTPLFMKVLVDDELCRVHCRMNVAEVSYLSTALLQNTVYPGRFKYTPLHRFVAFLIQLTHNYHYRLLRTNFGWASDSIHFNFLFWTDRIINILDADNSVDRIRAWTRADFDQFRQDPHVGAFTNCIGCVDSIFIEISRPENAEDHSRFFSWYKKMDALFFTVMCDRMGRIRYCDGGAQPRRQSDQASMGRSHLFLPPDLYLLGDGHYRDDYRCRAPFTYEQLSSSLLSANERRAMIRYNKHLRSQRILIEWIFSRIRGYFGIFDAKYTYHVSTLPRAFRAVCLLYNYISRVHNNWPGVNNLYYVEASQYAPDDADGVDGSNIVRLPEDYS